MKKITMLSIPVAVIITATLSSTTAWSQVRPIQTLRGNYLVDSSLMFKLRDTTFKPLLPTILYRGEDKQFYTWDLSKWSKINSVTGYIKSEDLADSLSEHALHLGAYLCIENDSLKIDTVTLSLSMRKRPIRVVTTSTTITPSDYTVISNLQETGSVTFTLPDAASASGQQLRLVNQNSSDGGAVALSVAVKQGTSTVSTIAVGTSILIQSDGTDWWIISGS